MTGGGLFYAKTTMTSGKIENWRSEPGRWSHRIIKSRRKEAKVESLRRSKSVDDDDTIKGDHVDVDKFNVVEEVQDDGYVEAESGHEPTVDDDAQVSVLLS